MSKYRSLENQMLHALSGARSQGESKRSYRADHGDTGAKVFSIQYETDIRETIKSVCNYLKANTDIKYVRDIQKSDLDAYLEHKGYSCNYNTCQKLKSHLVKIERICRSRYGSSIDWNAGKTIVPVNADCPVNIRDYVATQVDYSKLKNAMQTGRSETWKSVILSRYAGCRVRETAFIKVGRFNPDGGRWGYGTITLQGMDDGAKGGRWRTLDILTAEARTELSQALEGRSGGVYVIQQKGGEHLEPESITRAWERACKRAGVDLPTYSKNHAFRKLYAQECYNYARIAGDSKKRALDYAMDQLGHGPDRATLYTVYVHDQW